VSEKMLAETLRVLVRDGLGVRTVNPTVPPQVSYALSPPGAEIAPLLEQIRAWLGRWVDGILAAQRAYDQSRAP